MLIYSTFLGGSGRDTTIGRGSGSVFVDNTGSVYLTGGTTSTDFPTTAGAFQSTLEGVRDAIAVKLNPAGTALDYATLFGGAGNDEGYSITVDGTGEAMITGFTNSVNFDFVNAFQTAVSPLNGEAFVTRVDSTGTALLFSTALGGNGVDVGLAIATDGLGTAFVTGVTGSQNFPTTAGGFQQTTNNGGVYASANDGGTWVAVNNGLQNLEVTALAIDPVTTSTIYAGTRSNGIFKSISNGGVWAPVAGTLTGLQLVISALAIDPSAPQTIYAATNAGVLKSTDGGGTWASASSGIASATIRALAIVPGSPQQLYALTIGTSGNVYRTLDGGGTWTLATSGISTGEVFTVVADPLNASRAYLGAQTGFYSTTNAGASWTLLNPQIPARAIAADPISSGVVYAGFERAVYISANGGTSFTRSDSGIDEADIRSIAIDPTNNAVVYVAGASRGVFRSSNSGASWSLAGPGTVLQSARVVAIDPLVSSNVYVGGELVDAFVAAVDTSGGSLIYSTFIGERGIDEGAAIVLDGNKAIIAGRTSSPALPMVGSGPDQTYAGGALDGFVIGLDSAGSSLTFSRFVGGSDNDGLNAMARDINTGDLWAAGRGNSLDLPLANAFQPGVSVGGFGTVCGNLITLTPCGDAIVMQLSPTGSTLLSTYWGGTNADMARGIAVTSSGVVLVAGDTSSNDFPVVGVSGTDPPSQDAFVLRIAPVATSADLDVALGVTPDPVLAGGLVTVTATVTNFGPDPATNALLPDRNPARAGRAAICGCHHYAGNVQLHRHAHL